MRTILALLLWLLLFSVCWPLALFFLFLLPFVWLILLPFKIVGLSIELVFKFIGAVLMFPFRVFGR